MKALKKVLSLFAAAAMMFAMCLTVSAEETGSITIESSATVSTAGKTFELYKLMDVTYDSANESYAYTVEEAAQPAFLQALASVLGSGSVDVDKTPGTETSAYIVSLMDSITDSNIDAFTKAILAEINKADSPLTLENTITAGENETSVTFNNVPFGYYLIVDTTNPQAVLPVSALMLSTVVSDQTVTLKADKPTLDKDIRNSNDKHTTASFGEVVPYVLVTKIPDMTGYSNYKYVVEDTMSKGLTFNDDVAIKVNEVALTKDVDYTVEYSVNPDTKQTSITIVFKNFYNNYKNNPGAPVTIAYSATVNNEAETGLVPNTNDAVLLYSNNPNHEYSTETDDFSDEPNPGKVVGQTPDSITYTYVTELIVTKTDPQGNPLAGAEFELTGERVKTVIVITNEFVEDTDGEYWKLKDGTYTTTAPVTTPEGYTADQYESTTTKYAWTTNEEEVATTEEITCVGTTDEFGKVTFKGLAVGKYTLTETKAPDGYNLLKNPVVVTISDAFTTVPNAQISWYAQGAEVTDEGYVNVTVINSTGTLLPSTGGIGTTIFYAVGGALMIGAVVLLITKKRMNSGKE